MAMRMLSQLAHIELLTPKLEESAEFYKNILGLEESERTESSVYLRCWGERYHHSVKLTAGKQTAVGHIGWRSDGPDGLEEAVRRLEAAGVGEGWREGERGHGPAFQYRGPGGQLQEIFWEVERWQPPEEMASTYPSRPQQLGNRGCALRQIDHVTATCTTDLLDAAAWFRDTLGYRFMEYTVVGEDPFFVMLTTNEHAHDLGLLRDTSGIPGRIHHVAFWVDEPALLWRACDLMLEAGVEVEYGPGRHGMGEEFYCYTREPGGMRIEIMSGGRRNYEPDFETVRWTPEEGSIDAFRNSSPPPAILDIFPPDPKGGGFDDANPWDHPPAAS